MNGFSPCATGTSTRAGNPRKRVNFVQGFVLGADDLSQESTFLAGRAEGIARDLIGYGTVSGLRVTRETLPGGAGLVVGAGLALSPRGRPIVVTLPQAVALDEWVDARRTDVAYNVTPGFDSPPNDLLRLFVVLAYRQCPTDDKPGPGEPCRTDEPPRFFTRVADDFSLELRFNPPEQMLHDAIRSLQAWLRSIEVVDSPGETLSLDAFLSALRTAALGASPPTGLLTSPPEPLRVDRADAAQFLNAALVLWVTELRPLWQTVEPPDDAVLLAEVEVPLLAQPDGRWSAADVSRIVVNNERRPFVLPLRLVQGLTIGETGAVQQLTIVQAGATQALEQTRVAPFRVEAAGIVGGVTERVERRVRPFNGLRVIDVRDGEVSITFDDYASPVRSGRFYYVVKALAHIAQETRVEDRIEDEITQPQPVLINLLGFEAEGFRLGVFDRRGAPIPRDQLATIEMSIEVTRYVS